MKRDGWNHGIWHGEETRAVVQSKQERAVRAKGIIEGKTVELKYLEGRFIVRKVEGGRIYLHNLSRHLGMDAIKRVVPEEELT